MLCARCAVDEDLPSVSQRALVGREQDATRREPASQTGEATELWRRDGSQDCSQQAIQELRERFREGTCISRTSSDVAQTMLCLFLL